MSLPYPDVWSITCEHKIHTISCKDFGMDSCELSDNNNLHLHRRKVFTTIHCQNGFTTTSDQSVFQCKGPYAVGTNDQTREM